MPAHKSYDDDLFKESTMTFGEHLEELRRCLFKSAIGLFIGFLIGLYFGDWVVQFIQRPLTRALEQYYQDQAKDDLAREHPDTPPETLAAIDRERRLFDRVYIDPGALVEQLKGKYPELGGIRIPTVQLSPEDFPDVHALAAEIHGAGEAAAASPGKRIWSLLSPTERELVTTLARDDKPSDARQRQEFSKAFSGLLARPDFYAADSFAPVQSRFSGELNQEIDARSTATDATSTDTTATDTTANNSDAVRRLNWQLLTAAYPRDIKPSHSTLVPLLLWRDVSDDARAKAKSMGVQEPFMIWLKAALFAGVVIASPWLFYQIWSFVAAGLYPHEKQYVHQFLPFSLGLFLIGAATAFFFVFEPVLHFLFSYNRSLGISPEPRISEWLSFVLLMPLGFGIAFQLPLVMLFLDRIGVFSVQLYLEYWRAAVLVIFVLAAILTPADPYSMMFMAVPLTFLFFFGILICRFLPGERNRYQRKKR